MENAAAAGAGQLDGSEGAVGLRATLESGCVRGAGRIVAASGASLFVATPLVFSVGTRLVVAFDGPGGLPFRLAGRVAHRSSSRGHEGLGVRLVAPLPPDRTSGLLGWLRHAGVVDGAMPPSYAAPHC